MRGSLERTLFERLLEALLRLTRTLPAGSSSPYAVGELSPEETNRLWEDVYDDFRKLTENACAHLESEKVEELMRTGALVYKDTLTEYCASLWWPCSRAH